MGPNCLQVLSANKEKLPLKAKLILMKKNGPYGTTANRKQDLSPFFVAFPWVVTSTGPGGFMICAFIL